MEFPAFATSAAKVVKIYGATKLKETFLNASEQEFILYFTVLLLKCVLVAYGMKKLSGKVTFSMLFANFMKCCICQTGFYNIVILVIQFALIALVLLILHDESFHLAANAIALLVACTQHSFEFFIDTYLIAMFLTFIAREYGCEIDKFLALICYLCCLDWFTDFLLGDSSIGMMHAVLTVHIPLLLLTAFSPLHQRSLYNFIYFGIGLGTWQLYRISKAGLTKGINTNVLDMVKDLKDDFQFSDFEEKFFPV